MMQGNRFPYSKYLIPFFVCLFFLSGCLPIIDGSFELNLQPKEKWEITFEFILPRNLFGNDPQLELEQYFQQLFYSAGTQYQGGMCKSDNISYLCYQIVLNGTDYQSLNDLLGNNTIYLMETEKGKKQIVLDIDYGMINAEQFKFKVHGGKILSTNGTLENQNTVTWDLNHWDDLEVIMQEPGYFSFNFSARGFIFIILGGCFLFIALKLNKNRVNNPQSIGS